MEYFCCSINHMNMRLFFTLILLTIGLSSYSSTFTSKADGDWTTVATWTVSGSFDSDNIPDADDSVLVYGWTVTITGNEAATYVNVRSLAAKDGILNINGTGSLTAGKFEQVNTLTFQSIVNVLGNLTVTGNMTLNVSTTNRGHVTMNIGDATHSPIVSVAGLTTLGRRDAAGTYKTSINLYHGTLDLDGDLAPGTSASTAPVGIFVNVYDDGAFDGLTKRINLGGTTTTTTTALRFKFTLEDTNGNADYIVNYDGTTADQLFLNYRDYYTYKDVVISNTAHEVLLPYALDSADAIKGSITVLNDAVLNDNAKTINLNPATIQLNAGATFKRVNSSSYNLASFTLDQASIFEFYGTIATSNYNILNSPGTYYIVNLTGPGIKRIQLANTIDDVTTSVGSINVMEGTFNTASLIDLALNGTGQTKTISLASGTTWTLSGNINDPTLANFSFDINSTISYNSNNNQNIYDFKNSGANTEPYGNLSFAGTSTVKQIANGDNILVRGAVNFNSTTATLRFLAGGYLTLLSNASYTAYLGTMETTNTITYGTGNIVAQQYIDLQATATPDYRDFTSPIAKSDLENYEETGLELTGVINSNYPTLDLNVYKYDETMTGSDGWVPAANTNEQIADTGATSSTITRSAWRIYSGFGNTYTLSDTGHVNRDNMVYPLTFNHDATSDRLIDDGYHLIGNPYPSPLDWDSVYYDAVNTGVMIDGVITNGIEPTIYIYAPADYSSGIASDYYFSYNALTHATDPPMALTNGNILSSYQGFWVKAFDASATSTSFNLTIPESAKSNITGTFRKAANNTPEMITMTVSDGANTDHISFHTFPGATTGKDAGYDIVKFSANPGGPSVSPLTVNFAIADASLNLRVNAIPDGTESFNLPILLESTGAMANQTLTFNNLQALVGSYECVALHDLVTNTWTDLKTTNTYSYINSADYSGIRFVLSFQNSIATQSTLSDATCFAKEDGLLRVKFNNTAAKKFDLFTDNVKIESFDGNYNQIKTTLSGGSYKLVNKLGIEGCPASEFAFVIGSQPQIVFDVTPATPLVYAGKAVQLNNNTSGASTFMWTFIDDNSSSTEVSPTHTFANAGVALVKLDAISANEECNESKVYTYNVQDASGVQTLKSDDVKAIVIDGLINIINTTGNSCDYTLTTSDGRVVAQQSGITGNAVINIPSATGIYILNLTSAGKSSTTKFVL